MSRFKTGDIVTRKSYGSDILFKVAGVKYNGRENIVTLKGINYRILADAPESDLILQTEQHINEHNTRISKIVEKKCRSIQFDNETNNLKKISSRDTSKENATKFQKPGRVLHIDGDNDYLNTCLNQYKSFNVEAVGKYVPEINQPAVIYRLLQDYKPDILVLTGHDGVVKGDNNYLNLDNYRNSRYFAEAVKEARRYEKDLDSLVIFAGACQSMYNELINAGANFASSPYRVLIQALDPVFVCRKISYTSVNRVIEPVDVINDTITGVEGIGGVQTRGKYRDGFPSEPYKKQN